jgi:hypothetical protein
MWQRAVTLLFLVHAVLCGNMAPINGTKFYDLKYRETANDFIWNSNTSSLIEVNYNINIFVSAFSDYIRVFSGSALTQATTPPMYKESTLNGIGGACLDTAKNQLYFFGLVPLSPNKLRMIDINTDPTVAKTVDLPSNYALNGIGCAVFDGVTNTIIYANTPFAQSVQFSAVTPAGTVLSTVSVGSVARVFGKNTTACDIHPGRREVYFGSTFPDTTIYIVDISDINNLKLKKTVQLYSTISSGIVMAVDRNDNGYLYATMDIVFTQTKIYKYDLAADVLKSLTPNLHIYVGGVAVDQRDGQAYFLFYDSIIFTYKGYVVMPNATFNDVTVASFSDRLFVSTDFLMLFYYVLKGRPAIDYANNRAIVQVTTPYREALWSFPVTPFVDPIACKFRVSFFNNS